VAIFHPRNKFNLFAFILICGRLFVLVPFANLQILPARKAELRAEFATPKQRRCKLPRGSTWFDLDHLEGAQIELGQQGKQKWLF